MRKGSVWQLHTVNSNWHRQRHDKSESSPAGVAGPRAPNIGSSNSALRADFGLRASTEFFEFFVVTARARGITTDRADRVASGDDSKSNSMRLKDESLDNPKVAVTSLDPRERGEVTAQSIACQSGSPTSTKVSESDLVRCKLGGSANRATPECTIMTKGTQVGTTLSFLVIIAACSSSLTTTVINSDGGVSSATGGSTSTSAVGGQSGVGGSATTGGTFDKRRCVRQREAHPPRWRGHHPQLQARRVKVGQVVLLGAVRQQVRRRQLEARVLAVRP